MAWMWEYVGPDPYPRHCGVVARTVKEMDPANPPYPDWRPLYPLVKADAATARVIEYMHTCGLETGASVCEVEAAQQRCPDRKSEALRCAGRIRGLIRG